MSGTGGRVPRTRHANLRLGITPYPVQPSRPPPVHYYPGDGTIDPSLLCPSASSKCDIFSPASDSQSTADLRNSVTSALLHTSDAVYANPPSTGYLISPLSESSSPRAYAGSVSDDHYDDLRMAPLAPHTPRTRFRFPAYEAPCNATPGSPSDTGATPGKFSSSGSSSGGDGKNTGLLSPLTLLPDATLYDMYAFIRTDDLCAETTARYSSETAQHFDPAPPAYESVSRTPGYTPRLEEYAHDVADEQIPLRELSMCGCGLVIEVSSGDIVGRFTTASFAPACGHQAYMASTGTTATHPAQYAQLTPPVTLLRLPSAPASRGQGMNSSLGLYIPLDLDFTGNEGMDISPGSSLPDSPYSATFQVRRPSLPSVKCR